MTMNVILKMVKCLSHKGETGNVLRILQENEGERKVGSNR